MEAPKSACPTCGFAFAWNDSRCGHCHHSDSPPPTEVDRDDFIEGRILNKVGRNKLPAGRTWRFRDIAPEMAEEIRRIAGYQIRGRPVLAFIDSPTRWTLLTSREVLSWDEGQLREMNIGNMVSVDSESMPPPEATLKEIEQWKSSWEYLRVVDRQGQAASIWVPCGGEAYALWNILLPFAQGNQ